jgi:hypothetical protein
MTTIPSFVERLKKIGVNVELIGNYPWIYLDKINGKKVKGTFMANHGFTVFFLGIRPGQPNTITNISVVFDKIRETLNAQADNHRGHTRSSNLEKDC